MRESPSSAPSASSVVDRKPATQVWHAPEPMQRSRRERKQQRKRMVKKETPRHSRRKDLAPAILEELSEEEILVVLQVLSSKSSEAQRLLDDVRRRLDEIRIFDTFRQI